MAYKHVMIEIREYFEKVQWRVHKLSQVKIVTPITLFLLFYYSLHNDTTCRYFDATLNFYVPGNCSKVSKVCNAGSSKEEGDAVFRPQENWSGGEAALPRWYNCHCGVFRFKCHDNCCLEQTLGLSPRGWGSNPFKHPCSILSSHRAKQLLLKPHWMWRARQEDKKKVKEKC